ncbi:MAG: aldehyde ferredoxin oxidoreductase C-terminal domain-containing protein [Dehalococcoidales bacterium]|jgi:aldehyde:ferredoxin oxidoreductase
MSEFGYAGKILTFDLSRGKSAELATSDYAGRFLGGRGIAARLFYDLVPPETGALEPGNCLVCATGPVTGFFGLAGCRWVICGKSPLHTPQAFSYGNLGGKWGSALKYSGYDALAVTGKAEKPVYLFIHDDIVETRDAAALWGLSSFEAMDRVTAEVGKSASILAIGPAAENMVVFATALADAGASVSGGLGAVMGSKNLKAIAVAGNQRPVAARPEKLKEITDLVRRTRAATFDAPSPWAVPGLTRPEYCYGCGVGCSRQSYKMEDGRRYKSFCQASGIYTMAAMQYYGKPNDVPLKAVRLCDGYGLDSAVMAPLISWLITCYREGLLSEEQAGLPLSKAGSAEFIEALTHKISFREGFGDALADGTLSAAATLGEKAQELTTRFVATPTSETKDYDPRLILTTALMLATEPRRPISQLHGVSGNILISWCSWARQLEGAFFSTDDLRLAAQRFWGGEKAVDFSTCEGKALAAKKAQDRSYAQESLVLCDVHWPMMVTSANYAGGHVGDPSIESKILSAVTGRDTTEDELCRTGERIFNLVRAVQLRQGWGGRDGDRLLEYFFTHPIQRGEVFFNPDAVMPGPDGKIISRLGAVLDRNEFEKMKTDYYRLRGWDTTTGLPTLDKLNDLGLGDIAADLKKRRLLAEK